MDLYAHIPHVNEVHEIQQLRYDLERDDFYYEIKRVPVAAKATLEDVFPDAGEDGLFADWFTGAINFPQGEILLRGMSNKYKQYLSLTFTQGTLTGEQVLNYDEAYS